jgi:hypothetical protein
VRANWRVKHNVRYRHHPEVPPATKEGRLLLQSGLWQAIDGRVDEFTP